MIIEIMKIEFQNPEGVTLFALPKFLDINVNGRKILRNVNR